MLAAIRKVLAHTRPRHTVGTGFTRTTMPGSARLRMLAGAAIVGGAGAVRLLSPLAACEPSQPWNEPFSWHDPFSPWFRSFFSRPLLHPFELLTPFERAATLDGGGIQVTDADDGYEYSVALPGVRPADLDVSIEGGVLLLTGKSRHGSFERRLRLPRDADGTASRATFEHGLLTLSIPRAAAAQIKIKVVRAEEPAAAPEGALCLRIELPGVRSEDLRVVVQAGELVVTGKSEVRAGYEYRVDRRFTLPRDADAHQASASHTDGVLTVTIPTLAERLAEAPTTRLKILPAPATGEA